jgi:hypothetical protein
MASAVAIKIANVDEAMTTGRFPALKNQEIQSGRTDNLRAIIRTHMNPDWSPKTGQKIVWTKLSGSCLLKLTAFPRYRQNHLGSVWHFVELFRVEPPQGDSTLEFFRPRNNPRFHWRPPFSAILGSGRLVKTHYKLVF